MKPGPMRALPVAHLYTSAQILDVYGEQNLQLFWNKRYSKPLPKSIMTAWHNKIAYAGMGEYLSLNNFVSVCVKCSLPSVQTGLSISFT